MTHNAEDEPPGFPITIASIECGCRLVDASMDATEYVIAMCGPHEAEHAADFMEIEDYNDIMEQLLDVAGLRRLDDVLEEAIDDIERDMIAEGFGPLDGIAIPDYLPDDI